MMFVLTAISCDNDGGTSNRNLIEGGVPNIQKISTTDQGLNVLVLQDGGDVDMGVTIDIGQGQIASIDIIGLYTKNGVTEKGVFRTNVSTFPTEFHVTKNELINAFSTLNTADDFDILDKFIISADVTLKDGTILKLHDNDGSTLYGADVANSELFKVVQVYNPSCPLEDASIFDGDYIVSEDTWQDYAVGDIVPVSYVSSDGTFSFRILSTANPYINNPDTSYLLVTVNPTDNTVVVQSNEDFDYGPGYGPTTGTGTVGSCSGEINLTLAFGPYGGYKFSLKKAN